MKNLMIADIKKMFKTPSLAKKIVPRRNVSTQDLKFGKSCKIHFLLSSLIFYDEQKSIFVSRCWWAHESERETRRALPALSRIVSPPSLFSFCSLFLFFFFFVWNGHFFKVATRRKQFKFFFSLSKSLLLSLSLSLSLALSCSLCLSHPDLFHCIWKFISSWGANKKVS